MQVGDNFKHSRNKQTYTITKISKDTAFVYISAKDEHGRVWTYGKEAFKNTFERI